MKYEEAEPGTRVRLRSGIVATIVRCGKAWPHVACVRGVKSGREIRRVALCSLRKV